MHQPLAERMRPKNLDQIIGQQHILGNGKPLRTIIEKQKLHSLIFLGPIGCWQNYVGPNFSRTSLIFLLNK
ncbi:MAG: hypothetical protein R2807_00200 [Chitinophagales bacterium]